MCNEAARRIALDQLRADWSETEDPVAFPEGLPNMALLDSVKITDPSVIIRAAGAGEAELVTRRWSWPGPTGKPVYNFRSDGRTIDKGRCLIPITAFYEFTDPPRVEGASKRQPKSKWRFTMRGLDWFCVAGIWRKHEAVGEAWTMLTTEPGPDIAPYHDRQNRSSASGSVGRMDQRIGADGGAMPPAAGRVNGRRAGAVAVSLRQPGRRERRGG